MGGRNPWPDVPRSKKSGQFKSRGGCMLLFLPLVAAVIFLLGRL